MKLGDTKNAEKFFLQCLSFDKQLDSFGYAQMMSSKSLSNIYFNRGQYRAALDYLEDSKTKYRPLRMWCQGPYSFFERMKERYTKSRCYYGLNEKDSAIGELAPYIFMPRRDVFLGPSEFDEMTSFFVNTVFEVYGAAKAKEDLRQALLNISYEPVYETDNNTLMLTVDCYLLFAGTKIRLGGGYSYGVATKGEIPEFLSKDVLVKDFTGSPAYRYIRRGYINL